MKIRSLVRLAAAASLLASVSPAYATVTQPNGLVTPLDSKNGETQLFTMFANLGEPIDWIADAASTPNTFSPLCGFTSKFVLKQSGSSLGLAWYNDDGTNAPAAQDLHTIVPAGSPVGTVITGADIKSDPAYKGGQVGFALVGAQTHYSNPAWNPVCSGCNPAAPWVLAMIYPSKTVPNAFYIAFEDGSVGSTPASYGNDGDYNDDVFLVTGVTCQGGGQACDTGKPGICAAGLTQCAADGTTCQQLSQPSTEVCNNVDDDCDGTTDEGDICPSGNVCDKGQCVPRCGKGEFRCATGKVCSTSGVCVDPKCADVTCESGKVCVEGTCKSPCDGVVCPGDEVCRNGSCVDPCTDVDCGAGKVCDKGVCVLSCDCQPCGQGTSCAVKTGRCVETACAAVTCAAGQRCAGGTCVDRCTGVICPTGQGCSEGSCKPLPPAPDGEEDGGGGGLQGPEEGADAGASEQSADASVGAGASADEDASSGCGCVVAGQKTRGEVVLLGVGLGVALFARRRRRG